MREINKLIGWEEATSHLPQAAQARLSGWRGRTLKGESQDLRSQVWRGERRELSIARLDAILDRSSLQADLVQFEDDAKAHIGPYSIQLPWEERREDLAEYWNNGTFRAELSAFRLAVMTVRGLLTPSSLEPMSLEQALDSIPKKTSSGLPWFTSNPGVLSWYVDKARSVLNGDTIEMPPSVLFWRGQPTGLNQLPKQRVVWGYSKLDTILGSMFLYPVLDKLRLYRPFAAWNNLEVVDDALTHGIRVAMQNKSDLISSDFSGFDMRVNSVLIDSVREMLKFWFKPSATPTLDYLFDAFKTVGMLTPDGLWLNRDGGVPSGSVFTNLVDTLVNLVCSYYVAARTGSKLNFTVALGDDAVNVWTPTIPQDELEDVISELGLVSSKEKQFVSPHSAHFLQRLHSAGYVVDGKFVGVRPLFRSFNGMLSYERRRDPRDWNRYLAAARTIMQLENSKWHPQFREFVQLLTSGEEMLSQLDATEIFRRAGGAKRIGSVLGSASFAFTSRDPAGVERFTTVRILRELKR